jgi:hypothetical protein
MEFWKHEAYQIARKITSNHELQGDLVGHVFILMNRFDFHVSDIPAVFARFAYNQWNWQRSEFWRLYRSDGEAINDVIDSHDSPSNNEFSEMLDAYLHSNDGDPFIKEITKMHLCGMTFRDIKELTGISLDTIHKTIKQFKNDLHDYCGGNCKGVDVL